MQLIEHIQQYKLKTLTLPGDTLSLSSIKYSTTHLGITAVFEQITDHMLEYSPYILYKQIRMTAK